MVWIQTIAGEFWMTLLAMAPYLLFGFAVAGVLSAFVSQEVVERHLGGRGFWPVFKAAVVGVPMPLCSCGVIPVAASLHKHGASRGATASFLISTPQTGVDSIFVTYSLLGPVFAIFRPFVAFVTGVVGGLLTEAVVDQGVADGDGAEPKPAQCQDSCCSGPRKQNRLVRAWRFGFVTLPRDIGGALLLGMLVAGVIAAVIPDDFFAASIGTGILGIAVMMLLGIPLYVCATASVPIAAALIEKGVSPGAALAFLITGPATNAATITTLWKLLGPRSAYVYLATIALSALLSGMALDTLFRIPGLSQVHVHGEMLPPWLSVTSAVLLIVILAAGYLQPKKKAAPGAAG